MALKGGHCSEMKEKGARAFGGLLFTVKIRRGRSAGVPQLHVSGLSTHEAVKGRVRLRGNQGAPTPNWKCHRT